MSYKYTYMRSKSCYKHKCDQNPNKLQIRDQIQMKCDGINSAVPPEGSSVLSPQFSVNSGTDEHTSVIIKHR